MRKGFFIILLYFILSTLPLGMITMAAVCSGDKTDFVDYLLSLMVPGYGFFIALTC